MTQDEEIRRGMEAERLMNEPMMKDAFQLVEAAIIDALKRCDVRKEEEMKSLTLSLQLLGRIHGHFKDAMTTGRLARGVVKDTLKDKARGLFRAA